MNSLLAKAKPILFSTEMVKAIFEGRKTMTRRVVKPQPDDKGMIACVTNRGEPSEISVYDRGLAPYRPGDILYVRETVYLYGKWGKNGLTKTGKQKYKFVWDKAKPVIYAANSTPDSICTKHNQIGYFKRPSIFMPKEVARTLLKVKAVRVERLQEISHEDRIAEGIKKCVHKCKSDQLRCSCSLADFLKLWNNLNAKRGYGWETNPWVFVYEFERIEVL